MAISSHSGRKKRLMLMFTLTFSYMIAELLVGYMASSVALIADSFHMLSDVISLIVAFISIMLSPKKWKKSTFGWARAEVLGALINSVFLMALCFSIIMESVERFLSPKEITKPQWVLGIGAGGLLVNLIGLVIFHEGHGHTHHHHPLQHQGRLTRLVVPEEHGGLDSGIMTPETNSPPGTPNAGGSPVLAERSIGGGNAAPRSTTPLITEQTAIEQIPAQSENNNVAKAQHTNIQVQEPSREAGETPGTGKHKHKPVRQTHQLNMRGIFLHILADTLGSVVVIISAAIVWATKEARDRDNEKYKFVDYVDPSLSLIMVTLIMCSSWPLLQETSMILLQTVPTYIDMEDLKKRLRETVPGILGIHEFHVWQLAGDCVIASIHIVCKNVEGYIRISREAKAFLHSNGIHSTTIQAEFVDYENSKSEFDDKECFLNCPKGENPSVNCDSSKCCYVGGNAKDGKPNK